MAISRHVLRLLAVVVPVFMIGYLLEWYSSNSLLLGNFFEISTELLPFVLAISIFVLTWHAYAKNKDNNALFLGAALLVIGLFDMYHLLSYPFMPDFITPNSIQKTGIFWSMARLFSALLFLSSAFIYKDSFPRFISKSVLFGSVNVLSIVFLNMLLLYNDVLPAMYSPDGSSSTTAVFLVLLTSVIILYAGYLYSKRSGGQICCIICGFIIIIFSNLIYLSYDISGHLLKAGGYYFLYLGMFRLSVEQPYEKLVETEEKRRFETEAKYRSIFENASDAIITIDLEDRITSWNSSAERIFGWAAEEVIGKKITQIILPSDLLTERNALLHDAKSGKAVVGVETVRLNRYGTKIYVSITISPIRDMYQNIVGFSGIIRDVTERKKAEEQIHASLLEKEVLLREIHHRVKNNMQIISSLLKLQVQFVKDKSDIELFKDTQNRIMSMSLIHEKLYKSKDLTKINLEEYIKDLVNKLFLSYEVNRNRIAMSADIEDISLGVDTVIPCGLIINELVTNSLKHAFPGSKKGKINVTLHSTGRNEIELIVNDDGIGIPEELDFRKPKSLGLQLVTLLVENQLEGRINLDRSKGTTFQIKFKGDKQWQKQY